MAGTITLKFYGLMRGRVGSPVLEIAGDGLTVGDLLRRAERKAGKAFLDELLDRDEDLLTWTIILVNGENIRLRDGLATRVRAGDAVDCFSPAGGG